MMQDPAMIAYMTPEEAAQASVDQTDKALGAVIAMLYALYLEARNLRLRIVSEQDEDILGELEWELKMIRREESSLHRLESGLQSRLKVGK